MALGLLTTAAAAAKMSSFPGVYKGDVLQGQVTASILAKIEEQVGIICACLPTLKGPAERLLVRLGVLSRELHFTRPTFVMSTRHRELQSPPEDQSESARENEDGESGVSTLWLDSSNSTASGTMLEGESLATKQSVSSSERTLSQMGSKAFITRAGAV